MFFLAGVSFVLGFAAGFVMHRSDYCIAGMFRDGFLFRDFFMLRTLLLLVVVSMVLFEGARLLGFTIYPFPLLGFPSMANILGGFFFGIGMVLAGGCVVGILYKMGAGSLLGFLSFSGLILGSALYAEIHPAWSSFAQKTTFSRDGITLPQMLDRSPTFLVAVTVLCFLCFAVRWCRRGCWERKSSAQGYLQPWKAALALASIGGLSYALIGMPLGITTAYAKLGAYLEGTLFPGHMAGLTYFQLESLNYVPPFAATAIKGGAGPRFDAISVIQFPLIAGIIGGSAISAILLREFKIYVRLPMRQCLSAVVGGIIMGLAARMAPACNVWHLLGGVPILAAQSLLFLLGLILGAWLGSQLLLRFVLNRRTG